MNPRTFALDRVLVILAALTLILGGAWVFAWAARLLPAGWADPEGFRLGLPEAWTGSAWWPWALLLGGLAAALLGLSWLGAHFRGGSVGRLALPGDGRGGRLVMGAGTLAGGAADALRAHPDVTGASGRVVAEGRRLVLDLTATVRPEADLAAVGRACDDVAAHALRTSGREDLACRVRVKVARRARSARVR